MFEIKTEIEISAPAEKIWKILIDIEKWEQWSPTIKKAQGKVALNEKVDITMMGKENSEGPKYSPKIIELTPNKSFRWRAHMLVGFIFTNDKVFELHPSPNGTLVVHTEVFSGLMAKMLCSHMETGVPPMLNSMNQALKELAEK